jgi:hypothetical protein
VRAEASSPLTVTSELVAGSAVLTVGGVLDSTTYLALRDAIIKPALADPTAVIVDASALAVPAPSAWAVFTSARWHVGTWPEVPIVLVSAHAAGREAAIRNGVARYVPVYATTDDAIAALAHKAIPPTRRRARTTLPAAVDSLKRSRAMVQEYLTAWALTEFIPVAKVVVTAFVENALQYTDSAPNLRLETDGTTVTVAVEDFSHRIPGRREVPGDAHWTSGLCIVAALSRVWGNAPSSSGKTVWAVIGPENVL